MKTEENVGNKKRFDLGTLRNGDMMGWRWFGNYFWRDRRN